MWTRNQPGCQVYIKHKGLDPEKCQERCWQ